MNKSILQKFAIEARRELREKIKSKAYEYGIKEDEIKKGEIESSDSIVVNGKALNKDEKDQRRKLIEKIETLNEEGSNGFDLVIEEVAYTWFNRMMALRFMEVNRYIKTRVLSSEEGNKIPDIITEALDISFKNVDLDEGYIRELKLSSDIDATQKLFKYMVISQCNELNNTLPFMFEKISDYTELLFPNGLLDEGSFVSKMIDTNYIPEEDWEQVEIIGWLYQYYIAEEKDRVIKAKKKYKKEEIPFATQLFTPKWIVKYMVQNSLGRYWVESHPEDDELKKEWEFYLENPEKEDDFEEKIAPYINKELKVEDIKCFDPACGSGHILVYMFEVLYEIYSRVGYEEREIPRLIIENNLYGLDIDDRAYQLACFAVVMKGASYNKRLLRSIEKDGIKLNIASIQETNNLNDMDISYIAGERQGNNFDKTKKFVDTFYNGKTYGSLIKIDEFDKVFFEDRLEYLKDNSVDEMEFQISKEKGILELLEKLIGQADVMCKTYDILVTNPPYMGSGYMNLELSNFIKHNYKDSKSDTFAAFMEYCIEKVSSKGHLGFLTPFVWMFIVSYEKLRKYIIDQSNISSLVQLEYNAFPEACVPVCTFTLRNTNIDVSGEYIKLSDFTGSENQEARTLEAINDSRIYYRYSCYSNKFKKIKGMPISYWISDNMADIFETSKLIRNYGDSREGMATANNDLFLKMWYEVNSNNIGFGIKDRENAMKSNKRWFPYNKGGAFKRWFGNNEFIVNWENDGFDIRNYRDVKTGRVRSHNYNLDYIFKKGITWSSISSSLFSCRISNTGRLSDSKGPTLYIENDTKLKYILGFLNSTVAQQFLNMTAATIDYKVGDIADLPIKIDLDKINDVNEIVDMCVSLQKNNYDNLEISYDFKVHPIIKFNVNNKLSESIDRYFETCMCSFNKLKSSEENLNEAFIEIYDLKDELTPEIDNKNITMNIQSKETHIKSFISYSVGCMLGRYSLDKDGLVYAGGKFDLSKYITFKADEDNIIPILDESYFEDDIASRFIEFIKVTFGEETLNENLDYIAETLVKRSGESSRDTIRRYFLNDFYKDHVQTYKKRPIYWLVTSGKQKAFNALIYMHRYDKNTLSRIRTDYVHPLQHKLEVEKNRAEDDLSLATKASEKNRIKKNISNLDKQIDELKKFEEVLHDFADMQIEIDLDDGVVHNYAMFKGLLSKI
ncbi:MAG: BREX-1 system adenine-specific DNA-methyltransferase PglX [Terrisporobacter sp.]|uniref:BREX-1 system adenine-specific DNA-methyltransferase PglX n=1 Tax=Terrisporobacter sp. TaxID=1965305 RepID=UPI002FCC8B65